MARAGRRFQRAARPLDGQRVELLDHSPRGIVSDLGEDGVVARPARARVRGPGSGSGFGGSGSGSRIGASPRWSVVGDLGPRARGGISGFARLGAHQCVAGQLPTAHEREAVYMKRSGPALPPAQPTIPLLMIGPWQPQFGSCFGQARFPSGTTPAGQSPLTTRGGAAPLPPQLIRPCTRKSFSERYSSPPHWWVAANLGRRSRSAGGWRYLAGRTGGRRAWCRACAVHVHGEARRFNRAAHRMNSTLGAECSGSSRSRSVCSLPLRPACSLRLITDGEATAATAASAAAATGCGEGGGGEETVAAVSGCWAGTTAASVVGGAGVGGRCVRSVA